MFAQANSEHCRHKIFNASWVVDGEPQAQSLFAMIRETHKANPQGTVSAYSDNAAVMAGRVVPRFFAEPDTARYTFTDDLTHTVMKVETHNHPTAISPFAGAATGSGGEIRDEGATGRGAKPKAGLCGFSVSHLRLPGIRAAVGRPRGAARAHRVAAVDHDRRPDRRGLVQQRVRPPEPRRLLPHLRAGGGRHDAWLPQADHDCGRRRRRARPARAEGGHPAGRAPDPDRRPRHAHRHGRRLRFVHGHRREHRRSGLRLGAARQRRDPAARAGSDRPLLGARRPQPDPLHPRRRRGRPVERAAGARPWRRPRRRDRPAGRPERGAGHVAARGVVERGAGALRAGDRARAARHVHGALRARALPVRRGRRRDRRPPARGARSAVRQPAGGHGPAGAPRQAAADDARRAPRTAGARSRRPGRHHARGRGRPRAPASGRRRQDLPHRDRRPHGGRALLARPDGGPVAGAGGRLRRHADVVRRATPARRSPWASARRWR